MINNNKHPISSTPLSINCWEFCKFFVPMLVMVRNLLSKVCVVVGNLSFLIFIFSTTFTKENDQYHIRSTCKQNVVGVYYAQTKPKQSPSELSLLLSLVKVKCITKIFFKKILRLHKVYMQKVHEPTKKSKTIMSTLKL